ncbi:glycoside hydrolase family 127 protein [Sphingomonas mali]|uniref:glycoside hydrolase family 127 protein n=1 Tax=Sphingomonas mali TaxID=40682 RepID=UPI00083723A2|nr:glycoside hydrolase family 127 protein [Sphingomonas mali]
MLDTPLTRRRFARWLAASPVALGWAGRAAAEWNNVATPPVFAKIAPAPIKPVPTAAQLFAPSEVVLLDSPYAQAQAANIAYLKRLDPERLLHVFRINAGLPSSARPLGGWEDPTCELRGHFVGHYLSGCALAYAATGDTELKRRGDRIVAGLLECQRKIDKKGYLSAFPTSYFDRLAVGADVWAPFYTFHKIFAGLLDMHELAGSGEALVMVTDMARWTDAWTAARAEQDMQKILEVEFGGMNDALYRLAAMTGDAQWIAVGDRFTKKRVFEPLAGSKDALRGLHMNTHVPQVIGADRRFALTGDRRFGEVSDFFWDTVTGVRTYATGGSSNNEHWCTEPHHLAAEWENGTNHQESCCSYNMLKLGTQRFLRKPSAGIADYYERILINQRLATIQPDTGLTAYFLSLTPGAWKTWGTEETSFWCCNGSGLEDFATLNRMIYARDAQGIWVNLFIPSRVSGPDGVRLRQETSFPNAPSTTIHVEATNGRAWTLRLRIPGWTSEAARVTVNGRPVEAMAAPGTYLSITRIWRAGDKVTLNLPMTTRWEAFDDRPNVAALVHGPVVLAQQLPLGDVPAALMHDQGPAMAKAPPPVPPLRLPADLPARMRPIVGKPLHFVADLGAQTVELRPLADSNARFAVYSEVV